MTETIRGEQSTAALHQHIEELRGALAHAVRLLAHSAGREAADDPGHSERLMTTAVHLTDLLARTAPATATAPDILAVMEASDYVRHGGLTKQGHSYPACICPKAACGGVAAGTEDADCPEHSLNPLQALHWAAECPGRRA